MGVWLAASPALAQTFGNCSNDGQAQPRTLVERFLPADCAACWTRNTLPKPPRGAVTLDWVVPAANGDEAAMSAVAQRDAFERLHALGDIAPVLREAQHRSARVGQHRLRVQHGPALDAYMGASLAFHAQRGAQGPFTGWLAIAEWLPAGTEGTPVPRVLVRNLLTEPIAARPDKNWAQLWRPMNLPEGAQAERLGVVGWVTDARGRLVALAQARCTPKP